MIDAKEIQKETNHIAHLTILHIISPPSQKMPQKPGSVMISPPSKNNSLKQASATQNQQKDPHQWHFI